MTTPEDPFQPPEEGSTPAPPPPPDYSAPPPPPPQYGAPPPQFGAPPPQYGTPPPPYQGQPGYGVMPLRNDYASWGQRVGAAIIDYYAFVILAVIFYLAHVFILGFLLDLAALVWGIYNAYQGGETGQSYGKRMVGLKLIRESDGGFIGGGAGIGRYFLHILDSIPCIPVGLLWPLWDSKRQTFADKIMSTIVIKV